MSIVILTQGKADNSYSGDRANLIFIYDLQAKTVTWVEEIWHG